MEILATNTSYTAAIFLTIVFGLLTSLTFLAAKDKTVARWERIAAGTCTALFIAILIGVGIDPAYVTYDAIVTDWNDVYEQGYEVIETNGQIVTLRKVDE